MSNTQLETLFEAARDGDDDALASLYEVVYAELKLLARVVRRNDPSETLNTTALVHEAYEKLLPAQIATVENRSHFLRLAARAMRFVVVDGARKRKAEKRGGNLNRVTLDEEIQAGTVDPSSIVAVEDALSQLEKVDVRKARVVECRFFAGLTAAETAQALDISVPTVQRDWRAARAWLAAELKGLQ